MTMRNASAPSKGGSADEHSCLITSAFTSSFTSVDDVCQRRNTAFPRLGVAPLTDLPAATSENAVAGLFARPLAHGQFRLLPVPLDHDSEWNERIADWVRS